MFGDETPAEKAIVGGVKMFGFFEEKIVCPSCSCRISGSVIRVSRHRTLKIYNCQKCKADYVKNRRSELFPVLEEGAILC